MPDKTHILLYDDQCHFCILAMKTITWLDWFNRLSLLPISNPKAAGLAVGVHPHDLMAAIHCVTAGGRILRGARALRFSGLRMVLTYPIAITLFIPGMMGLAERVYMWFASNRYVMSRLLGCEGACAVLPTRERANEKLLDNLDSPA